MLLLRVLPVVLLLCAATIAVGCAGRRSTASQPRIEYRARIPAPTEQYIEVELRVSDPAGTKSVVALPAWTPGSYKIRDYARHVYDVRVVGERGEKLGLERLDKQSWQIQHGGRSFLVSYRIFADERSVRDSFVDDRGALINGASVWMYVRGAEHLPSRVALEYPKDWGAYTALPSLERARGRAVLRAKNYDALVDGPVLLGTPVTRTFQIGDTVFEYVLDRAEDGADGDELDIDRLVRDASAVVRALGDMMGGFPMRRYVFLVLVTANGGGGLEHEDSTVMMLKRGFVGESAYHRAVRLTAHEFFHAWNVKRIRDAALRQFDYARETYTQLLWLHEGFTRYVEDLALVRAGLLTPIEYLDGLEDRWTAYQQIFGRNYDPVAQLSFEAWVKQYQPAGNHANVSVSYYEKGAWIGLLLDLELHQRAAAKGRQSGIMALFRRLMASHGRSGRGLREADLIAAVNAEAGENMRWFFERYIHGREPLPIPAALERMGVSVTSVPLWESTVADASLLRAYSGLVLSETRVTSIAPGSPAARAGLMRADQIRAVDEQPTEDRLEILQLLADAGPAATVELTVDRDGRTLTRALVLEENPHRAYRFEWRGEACITRSQSALRKAWMQGVAPPAGGSRCATAHLAPRSTSGASSSSSSEPASSSSVGKNDGGTSSRAREDN